MKQLCIDDMYLLSEIIEKMDFKIPDIKGKDQSQLGAELLIEFFKKLHKAKIEVNQLIESLTDKNPNEMSLLEIKDIIIEILKQDGIMDFFN